MLTKAQYGGLVGGIIGGLAVVVWQWRRLEAARADAVAEQGRGEIIFSNTPRPSDTLATTNAEDVDKATRITM